MKKQMKLIALPLLYLAVAGGYLALSDDDGGFAVGNDPDLPTLTFYTTGLATTPQLPFWWAVRHGPILKHCNLRVKMWKTLDDLRGVLLAGKGDLWLGHTEGFAQAALRKAPVRLVVVSGWRKFYLLSTNRERSGFSSFQNREIPFAPVGSPAVAVMRAISNPDENKIRFKPFEPRQLAMLLVKGKIDSALVPEPLVSVLLGKVNGLRIIASVEEIYGQRTGHPPRMPIAGLAVHLKTAEKYPDLIRLITHATITAARELRDDPQKGIEALPKAFEPFISRQMVEKSLSRDIILVKTAMEAETEIRDYLEMLMPQFDDPAGMLWLGRQSLKEG